MSNKFTKFYTKSIQERKTILKAINRYDENLDVYASNELFDHLIENFITTYELPMGLAPNFLIDDVEYIIPMVTEEPSVIAAASNAAKMIAKSGGFKTRVLSRTAIGQIIFKNVTNFEKFKQTVFQHRNDIFKVSKSAHPQIFQLGGGLKDFYLEDRSQGFVCLYALIDSLDAMGANTINTILEAISQYLEAILHPNVLMSILSNLATNSLVEVTCSINPSTLNLDMNAIQNLVDASTYATLDPYRAVTHNKGIMNGITAVTLATGNDTRAVEAAAHAYASLSGQYLPLATWSFDQNQLIGKLVLPMGIGTVGGSIKVLPKAKLAHKILDITSAKTLMGIVAAVGLAQNFAALYALTTEGIQKGHMRLHARTLAIEAGATLTEIPLVTKALIESGDFTLEKALFLLSVHRN